MKLRGLLPLADKHYSLGDCAARSLARFLLAVGFARLLTKPDYAHYVLAVAVEVIVLAIANSLLVAPVVTLLPGRPMREQQWLFADAMRRLLRFTGMGLAAAFLLTPALAAWSVPPITFIGFILSLAGWSVCLLLRGRLNGRFESRRALTADILGLAVPGVALLVAITFRGDLQAWFWWSHALGSIVACAAMADRPFFEARDVSLALRSRVRDMGLQMTIGALANSACSRIQPFVLALAGGAAAVSDFGVSATLVGPVRLLSMAVSGLLRPRVALHFNRSDNAGGSRAVWVGLGMLTAAGLALTLLLLVAGDPLARTVFGEDYAGLRPVLVIAGVFVTLEAIGAALVVLVQATLDNGPALATRIRIVCTLVSLVAIWPMCRAFGALGAFGVMAAVELAFLAVLYAAARNELPFPRGLRGPAGITASIKPLKT